MLSTIPAKGGGAGSRRGVYYDIVTSEGPISGSPKRTVFLSPIHRVGREISVYFEERVSDMGVSPLEGHVLSYLRSYAPSPIAELVRVFGIKQSTLTSLLDRLEDRGLLERAVNPEDRRSFVITPTKAGRKLAAAIGDIGDALERDIRARVTAADVRGFEKVIAAIDEATGVRLRER